MNLLTMQGNMMLSSSMALTGTLPNGTVGVAYSANLTLTGAYTTPITMDVSSGTLPSWMTVSQSLPNINYAGTPTTAETETFTPRATDSSGTPQVATDPQSIVIASASVGPAYVNSNTAYNASSVTSLTVAITWTPASGDLLTAEFQTISTRLCLGTGGAPTGWTLLQTQYGGGGTVTLQRFSKISDGTETGITFTTTSAYKKGGTITEWSSAKVGSITGGASVPTAGVKSWSVGPSDSPAGSTSIPSFAYNGQNSQSGMTANSPWIGIFVLAGSYANGGTFYQAAPNAAVSLGVTGTTNTGSPYNVAWSNIWIDPA